MTVLVADIGGTNVRFGLSGSLGIEHIKVLSCQDYPTLADAANAYLKSAPEKPVTGAFAIACPLNGTDHVEMVNHAWDFSISDTTRKIGLEDLRVINDFMAIAHSVPWLCEADLYQVGGLAAQKNMPIGIIGPGTGLGVAAVMFSEDKPFPISTEGGHVTMPATTTREFLLFEYLRQTKYSHISAERVVSGKGLVNLYHAICGLDNLNLPDKTPAEITDAALKKTCKASAEALDLFCHFLGVIAGNLALSYGAFGGIYIAGGIVPQLGDYFRTSRFRESFLAKGRFSDYLSRIPAFVIMHPYPGLEGLRRIA
jgi:glucokinase